MNALAAIVAINESTKARSVPIEMLSTAGIVAAFAWLMLGWLRKQMEAQALERANLLEREAQERIDMRNERMTLRDDTRKEIHSLREIVNLVSLKNSELGLKNAALERQFAECEAHRVDQDRNIERLEAATAALTSEVRELRARQTEHIDRGHHE